MPFFGKKRKKTTVIKPVTPKPKIINDKIEFVPPARYSKPIPELLTIFSDYGTRKVVVARLSSEEIKLPSGEILYTGVPSQPDQFRLGGFKEVFKKFLTFFLPFYSYSSWRIYNMNYAFRGQPFTFYPQTNEIMLEKKKISLLIDQGLCIPYNISAFKTIYILISRETGFPVWKKDKIPPKEWFGENLTEEQYKAIKKTNSAQKITIDIKYFSKWLSEHPQELDNLDYAELPVHTVHDVTEIETVKGEWGSIIYGNALKMYSDVQDEVGDRKDQSLLYMIVCMIAIVLVVFAFLFYANEGVFM
jgi:hypothetical protein